MKSLDGAGLAKMATLDEAVSQLQRVHGLVERMALEVRANKNTAPFRQQIQRAATPLVGLLKGQFGMIADQVSALLLVLTRGGSDQSRLRSLRESVAQIRTALEISVARVKEQHGRNDELPGSQ
ncbi:MAG: hypothetical protein ACT4OZ_03935 [Gemmatimonadota bacterium]